MPATSFARVALCLSLIAIIAPAHSAKGVSQSSVRERVDQSVEMRVIHPPVIVNVDGMPQLVHELHITNMRREPVTLRRVQVLAPAVAAPLADLQAADLAGRIGRPGLPPAPPEPLVIGPGLRAVVNVWTAVPGIARAIREVSHRAELTLTAPDGSRTVQVNGGTASLSGASAVVIDPPLGGGPWVAIYNPLLVGGHRTSIYTLDGRARIPGRFAIDWVRAPEERRAGEPASPPDATTANGFGANVLAVADARVAGAVDDMPDLPPGILAPPSPVPLERASGNYVVLDLGDGRFAFYEHLRQGSIVVRAGERVRKGQTLAQLGSSGSTSIGPHLHFHVADTNSALAAEGLPFVLRRFEHLGAYPSLDALRDGQPWTRAASGRAGVRRMEHPASVAVVRF
jgi:murein DD-endopeptidase